MISSEHDRLQSWAQNRAYQEQDSWELWSVGIEPVLLETWPGKAADEARALTHCILESAQDDADSRGEAGAYELRHTRDRQTLGRKRFRRDASGRAGGGYTGSSSEIVGQALAHNQAYAELYQGSMAHMLTAMERQLDRAYKRIEFLETQQQETLQLYAEARQLLVDVESQAATAEASEERQRLLTEKAGKVVDLVLAQAARSAMESGK